MSLKQLDKQFQANLRHALDQTVESVARGIELRVPKDTGKLAGSVAVEPAHAEGHLIVASVTIGGEGMDPVALEYGTAEMSPQPFFRSSVNHAKSEAIASLSHLL